MEENNVKEVAQPASPPTKLTDVDQLTVELAKTQRQLALSNAKAALAEQEKVELQYKMLVQNLFARYGLGPHDRINEDGTIVRGGTGG